MKKSLKKVLAVASAMALTAASCVSVCAVEKSTYTGTISGSDLTINMDLPADGSLTIKPFSGTQITTDPLVFFNKNAAATQAGEDNVSYVVGLAGYTCVATSVNEEDPIKVAATLPATGTSKTITATIELGQATASVVTDNAVTFKSQFVSEQALAVTTLSEESYNGTAESVYTKNTAADATVTVDPQKYVPFRIIGSMNTEAAWQAGDQVVIVPVFSIGVTVTPYAAP